MGREEKIQRIREVVSAEPFAVFAFAGTPGEPPYSSVMFCAETPELDLVFATSPGSIKTGYLQEGNGVCVQLDNRAVGHRQMERFARVTVQGRLRRVSGADELDELHALYRTKLPFAAVFLDRPGVLTYRVSPTRIVFSCGFTERIDLSFGS